MFRQRPLLVLIAVPAVVSLVVTLLILVIWDSRQPEVTTLVLPTYAPTSQIAPRETRPPVEATPSGNGESAAAPTNQPEQAGDNGDSSPGCENPVHAVEAGQVLGAIAEQYSVSVAELIELNQLINPTFNPDVLAVGQQLVIPVCGIPTLTPTLTPTNTEIPTRNVPTPIPTSTQLPPGTILVAIADVLNIGDITSEAVEIVNEGSPVDLEGWILDNGRGDEFEFPSFRLFSGGRVAIHTGVGENTPIDLYWGLNESAWESGDVVSLYDADGELQDEFTIP